MMYLLHAAAAALTALIYLMRRRCRATVGAEKQGYLHSGSADFIETVPSDDCMFCARSSATVTVCRKPKYKRDPDIQLDNEDLMFNPVDND